MDKIAFDVISGIYTEGNLQRIRHLLLHSSSWQQGQFTAYGESQHSRLWINWLTQCGVSDITRVCQVDNDLGRSAILLEMKPAKSSLPTRAIFWLHHNGEHIKSVDVSVDTHLLQDGLGGDSGALATWWPNPDPLIISDYDQQLHPKTAHASPSDFFESLPSHISVLEQWWEVWQTMQLSHIWQLYTPDSDIFLPGKVDSTSADGLFAFVSQQLNQVTRHYCQIEDIIFDQQADSRFAIKWNLEGDVRTETGVHRVRLPFMSLLELDQGKIKSEYLIFDQIAFNKQFKEVSLTL